jgi:hypothetical protein
MVFFHVILYYFYILKTLQCTFQTECIVANSMDYSHSFSSSLFLCYFFKFTDDL